MKLERIRSENADLKWRSISGLSFGKLGSVHQIEVSLIQESNVATPIEISFFR